MRILLAFRIFFLTLFRGSIAARVRKILSQPAEALPPTDQPEARAKARPKVAAKPKPPPRSEAVTLLATLQREARFVDFLMEPLEGYPDAQIGAVARDVHRDCAKTVARLFEIVPVVEGEEGSEIEVPAGFDAGRFRLTGSVTGEPPFRGQLAHHGWQATRCELPAWSGSEAAAKVVAPAEVEL